MITETFYLVRGQAEACEVLDTQESACVGQFDTCLNACQPEWKRYDFEDGTSMIFQGLQGGITDGWYNDSQSESPDSCPMIMGSF